jgi:hypothetical protein
MMLSFWARCIVDMAPGIQTRLCENVNAYLKALEAESNSRDNQSLPDIAAYMPLRRDNSGCRPCFDLLEYSHGIELPQYVLEDPKITLLTNCTNDFVALSNVRIFLHDIFISI